jgi:Terpene synthase family 2, C-terminal metal binding
MTTDAIMPLPELHMTFPERCHPDLDWAEAHAKNWIAEYRLVPEGRLEAFVLPKIGHLAAYGYPTASREVLGLAADWAAWLYAFDDLYADEGTPDIVGVTSQIATMLAALEGTRGISPLSLALNDISTRFAFLSTANQHARFIANVKGYLLGVLAECTYRTHGEVPATEDYLPLRLQASGCLSCLSIAELATGGDELDNTHANDIAALNLLGAYVVALANDVYSCLREIDKADVDFVFNLPLVLAHHEAVELEAAISRSVTIVQGYIDRFTLGCQRLAPTLPQPAARQLEGIVQWTQGTFDWMTACGRYSSYWASINAAASGAMS